MDEPTSRSRTADRDYDIWQRYTNGQTQTEIAAAHGLAQSTVSDIIARMRDDIPIEERRARQRRQLADLDHLRQAALDLVDAEPIPAYASGTPIEMPDGSTAQDHTGRVRAMDMVIKLMERESRALGTDAPTRVSIDAQNLGDEILSLINTALTDDDADPAGP